MNSPGPGWNRAARFQKLEVDRLAMDGALRRFEVVSPSPAEERFAPPHRVRRSSRSVCANDTEAWQRRPCRAAVPAKLNDADAEAQAGSERASDAGGQSPALPSEFVDMHDHITRQLARMPPGGDRPVIESRPRGDMLRAT